MKTNLTKPIRAAWRFLQCFVLLFWPVGVLILERNGWTRFDLRKKVYWSKPCWMTAPTGGLYPYREAVQIFKQNA